MFNPTVAELVTDVRRSTNFEKSQFVTDIEIVGFLNSAHMDLYDLIVSTNENYFVSTSSFMLTTIADSYSLPTDFYKLLGVDMKIDSDRVVSLKRFSLSERNKYGNGVSRSCLPASVYSYSVQGLKINFIPKPTEVREITLWYVPMPNKLVLSNPQTGEVSSLDIRMAMYEKYLTLSASIDVLNKEESSTTTLVNELDATRDRIIEAVSNRDTAEPDRVTDGYSVNYSIFDDILR